MFNRLQGVWVLILLLMVLFKSTFADSIRPPGEKSSQLNAILQSFKKAITFYDRNYQSMELDGILGLKLLLRSIYHLCYFGGPFPFWATQKTCELELVATALYSRAAELLKSKNLTSLRRLGFLLDIDWRPFSYRPPLPFKVDDLKLELTEKDSDICLEKLDLDPCNVPKFCKDKFFAGLMSSYGLTHQVLYSYLLTKAECYFDENQVIANIPRLSYMDFGRIACQRVKKEFESVRTLMHLDTSMRDLGLEQIFVCGLFGDLSMTSPSLLPSILSWQDASGCFKSAQSTRHARFDKRNLLHELKLKDGCLTHLTSVAIGALMIYLHKFMSNDPNFGNYLLYLQREEIDHTNRFLPPLDPSPEIPFPESGVLAKPFASVPESLHGFERLCPGEPIFPKEIPTWTASDALLLCVVLPFLVFVCVRVFRMMRSVSAPPAARIAIA